MDLNDILLVLILTASWVLMVYSIIMLVRNNAVHDYRLMLARWVAECSRVDAAQKKDFEWRWQVLEGVNYNDMVFKFWRPLESYWPDKRFLEVLPEPLKHEEANINKEETVKAKKDKKA